MTEEIEATTNETDIEQQVATENNQVVVEETEAETSFELNPRSLQIMEAALFAAGEPLGADKLAMLFEEHERPDAKTIKELLEELSASMQERGVELKKVASGYRFQAKQEYAASLQRLWEKKPPRYSRALLETLALIVYRQPITRGEIEDVRGVAVSSHIIKTLLEREWVKIVGHRDVPGKPALFGTTKKFLDDFNLAKLSELPPLQELVNLDELGEKLGLNAELIEAAKAADEQTELSEEMQADGEAATEVMAEEQPAEAVDESESEKENADHSL
jgi:segregation and condensation protein B